ncbi:MAG: acyl carrier protein [Thermoguttaceae bacterium]
MDRVAAVQEIFRQVFDKDAMTVSPSTRRADVSDWDSVAHVKLILTLEDEFQVRFSEDEISSVDTVGDLLKAIDNHVRADT